MELFVANGASLYTMYLLIYVAFSIGLVALVPALHERLKADAAALMRAMTAFGLIWAGPVIASEVSRTIESNCLWTVWKSPVAHGRKSPESRGTECSDRV